MASELLACCGLYCGACSFRLAAEENDRAHLTDMPAHYDRLKDGPLEHCPGCRLENKCGECAIRDCVMERGIASCAECPSFPCEKIRRFNDDGRPHHGEAIGNLKLLAEIGEARWLEEMSKKWTCACGKKKSWYHSSCGCP